MEAIREALRVAAPQFADTPIAFLAEGWEFWAFEVGGYVLRFPKMESAVPSLRLERALLPSMAAHLSVPVPHLEVWGEGGPNGAPFAGHRKLPGAHVWPNGDAPVGKPSRDFGRQLGGLIRELHSFPVREAKALGVQENDVAHDRAQRIDHFEKVIRRVFPLVSCEARTHIEAVYRDAINESAYYTSTPCFRHGDLDVNTLIDAEGNISGLLDFGGCRIASAAIDFWLPVYGFDRLGIGEQSAACIEASGISAEELDAMLPELAYINLHYPVHDILHGLETGQREFIEDGIKHLNTLVPRNLRC
jgi:aminoglycoside phosphotransferase (APT) family kinase protein